MIGWMSSLCNGVLGYQQDPVLIYWFLPAGPGIKSLLDINALSLSKSKTFH